MLGILPKGKVARREAVWFWIFILPWVIGFILFRVMEVVKPPPARQFEHFKGGIGIVADDLMAGVYAHLALRGILAVIG